MPILLHYQTTIYNIIIIIIIIIYKTNIQICIQNMPNKYKHNYKI